MSLLRPAILGSLLIATLTVPVSAAIRLTTSVNGTIMEVQWSQESFPIRYKTDERLISALGSTAMLDRAFAAWSNVPSTNVSFQSAGAASGLRAGKDGQNVVTVADDLFANQRAIAITTNWDERGVLVESDIQIDPSMVGGSYNMQQAITHEIGHLLGLDHSGVLSAVMYPYVSRGNAEVVLDSDDRVGIATMYADGNPTTAGGVLRGRVAGNGSGIFAAQVVAVNENGEPITTSLTNSAGEFTMAAMPDGTYRLYVEPLDGPVDTRNLSPYWRQGTVTSFPTQFFDGAPVNVRSGQVIGNIVMNTAGQIDLNPRWIGVAQQGSSTFTLASTASLIRAGQTVAIAVAGDGITPGMTTYEVMTPGLRRVSDFRYAGNYVYADWQVATEAPSGSVVIVVRRGNEMAALTGALRLLGTSGGGSSRTRIAGR